MWPTLNGWLQRFSEILQLNKVKTSTAHVQYLKDQRKQITFHFFVSRKTSENRCISGFAYLPITTNLKCTVLLLQQDFYYTVITSDLSQRICGYQCSSEYSPVASFTKLTVACKFSCT